MFGFAAGAGLNPEIVFFVGPVQAEGAGQNRYLFDFPLIFFLIMSSA
jgi:hypothetical protein